MADLTRLGAALTIDEIESHLDWLADGERDLELQDFFEPELLEGDWRAAAERARRLLDGYPGRYGIHGPFKGFSLDNPDPFLRAVSRQRLERGLDVAEILGAGHMVMHSPISSWRTRSLAGNHRATELLFARVHDLVGPLIERAEEIGCTLVIENIQDTDPILHRDLVASFGSERVRVSVDLGHAYCLHRNSVAPAPDHWLAAVAPLLAHIHVQDTDGYADRHWLPGEGNISFRAVLAALAAIEQRPVTVLEIAEGRGRLREGAAWLRELELQRA